MKTPTVVLLALLALSTQGCNEALLGDGSNIRQSTPSIVGEWVWLQSEGGVFHQTHTPASSGFEARLTLRANKGYVFEQTNGAFDAGKFISGSFDKQDSLRFASMVMVVSLFSHALPGENNLATFRGNDTLVISGLAPDTLTYTYLREK